MKIFTRALPVALLASFLNLNAKAQTSGVALSYSSDDYLQLPSNLLTNVTGDFTIEAWVYWTGPAGTQWHRIFDFGSDQSKYMFLTPSGRDPVTNTNRLIFAITEFGNCCEQRLTAPAELTPNTWNHIAVTLNNASNTGTMYLNGTAVATNNSMTYDISTILPTSQNWIGRSQYPTDPFFEGTIDEFRISSVVRYTANFTPQQSQFANDGNTVALYHFSEGMGQTTADASGNNFTATLGATSSAEASDPTWTTGSILPITVSHFAALKGTNTVDLKWTASVTGSGGQFVIERSTNGTNFQPIGSINIAPNAGIANYSFTDRQVNSGKNYYRLKVVEVNAPVKYSAVVIADLSGKGSYTAYPTVTTSRLFIQIPKAATISIYNSNGMMVKQVELQGAQHISVADLSKGVYQVQFEGSKETVRFIKQ